MRVLIAGYSAAAHSSFGSQTRDLWSRLVATGDYEVVQQGWFHRETMEGTVPPWQIIPTNRGFDDMGQAHNVANDRYGEQSLQRVLETVRPDIVWSLADPFMQFHLTRFRDTHGFKLVTWNPIDGVPFSDRYAEVFCGADESVGITRWGAQLMQQASNRTTQCIYHGVDTDLFRMPAPDGKKKLRKQAEERYGIPQDAVLLGWVGKNQFRKMPWIMYPLLYYMNSGHWAQCRKCTKITPAEYDRQGRKPVETTPSTCRHCGGKDLVAGTPIKTHLWSHMYEKKGGIRFEHMHRTWNVEGKVTYTTGLSQTAGMKITQMAYLYQLMDVYLSLSGGEGFNIPLIEAASCGVPCVYTDYSGQAEVGSVVNGRPVEIASMLTEHHTGVHADRAIACIGDAIRQVRLGLGIQDGRRDVEKGRKWGEKARRAAEEEFDWNVIVPQWQQILDEVMSRPTNKKIFGGIA